MFEGARPGLIKESIIDHELQAGDSRYYYRHPSTLLCWPITGWILWQTRQLGFIKSCGIGQCCLFCFKALFLQMQQDRKKVIHSLLRSEKPNKLRKMYVAYNFHKESPNYSLWGRLQMFLLTSQFSTLFSSLPTCVRTPGKHAPVSTHSASHILLLWNWHILTPGEWALNACVFARARVCVTASAQTLGASTHPWAIREWISEASVVILNGSRLL